MLNDDCATNIAGTDRDSSANSGPAPDHRLTTHKRLIAELVEQHPEVRTHGFWKAMRSLPDAEYVQDYVQDKEIMRDRRFIPDAWAIDPDERIVTIFEVVDTHDIPPHTMSRMVNFGFALDEDYYALAIVRVDVFGRRLYDPMNIAYETALASPSLDADVRFKGWQRYAHAPTRLTATPKED